MDKDLPIEVKLSLDFRGNKVEVNKAEAEDLLDKLKEFVVDNSPTWRHAPITQMHTHNVTPEVFTYPLPSFSSFDGVLPHINPIQEE
jgi:hypothetical protein